MRLIRSRVIARAVGRSCHRHAAAPQANIANDECDFGASLQLGLDMLNHAGRFARQAASVLVNAYTLLDRPAFATIARLHGAQRAAAASD